MPDEYPQFEGQDTEGSSDHFNGTVGTTATNVPSSAGNVISEFLVDCPKDSPGNLLVSLDGGTTFKTVNRGGVWIWTPKGNMTQIKIKGTNANTDYEIVMNREPF
jgi:hypothetical protein